MFCAVKIQNAWRTFSAVQEWRKSYWLKHQKIEGLFYGYKVRKILKKPTMVDLKGRILARKAELEIIQNDTSKIGQIEELSYEVNYLVHKFLEYYYKYTTRGFNYEEMLKKSEVYKSNSPSRSPERKGSRPRLQSRQFSTEDLQDSRPDYRRALPARENLGSYQRRHQNFIESEHPDSGMDSRGLASS
jgi:hypothetical protein